LLGFKSAKRWMIPDFKMGTISLDDFIAGNPLFLGIQALSG
jgi:hypothetical protein